MLVCSILIKYITLVTIPVFFLFYLKKISSLNKINKFLFYKDLLKKSVFFLFLIFIFFLPYIKAGKYIFETLILFNQKWKFNGFIHRFFIYFFGNHARYFSVACSLLILLFIYFKLKTGLIIKIELTILVALLFNNALFPGYMIWIVPFLVFNPRISTFFLVGIISISYHVFIKYKTSGVWDENNLILYLQYIPFYILFIYDLLRGSYAKQFQNSSNNTGP